MRADSTEVSSIFDECIQGVWKSEFTKWRKRTNAPTARYQFNYRKSLFAENTTRLCVVLVRTNVNLIQGF